MMSVRVIRVRKASRAGDTPGGGVAAYFRRSVESAFCSVKGYSSDASLALVERVVSVQQGS